MMQRKWRTAVPGTLFEMGLLITAFPPLAHACAVCVGSSGEDYGYFWGVLFLMSMPFALGGLIGGWLLYSYRHYRRVHAGPAASALTPTVQRGMHPAAPTISPSDGRDDGSQTTDAEAFRATDGGWFRKEKESTP